MSDLFDKQLRDAARALPVPDAPPDLIDRVIAERAAGERIILPVPGAPASVSRPRWMVAAGMIAAAAVLAAIGVLLVPTTSHRANPDDIFASDGFFAGDAYAEQTSSGTTAPALTGVNALTLVPRVYRYRIDYVDSTGRVDPDGGGSITLTTQVRSGVPVWRFELVSEATYDAGQRRAIVETLYVTRRDLRPLERVIHTRPYLRFRDFRIEQRFVGDSVLGQMQTDSGIHRPIARRLPAQFGPYMSDAIAPIALVGVPLEVGKTVSLSLVGWAVVPMDVFYRATLKVIGEERIGPYDCWKLEVHAGRNTRIQWVRKSDGLALRSYDPQLRARGHRQYQLLNP